MTYATACPGWPRCSAAGAISYRLIAAVVSRTRLIKDSDALAKVDTEIAAHVTAWGSLSVDKTQNEIDYWVDRYDPAAVRRTEDRARGRFVDIYTPEDGCGHRRHSGPAVGHRRRGPRSTPRRDGRLQCASTIHAPSNSAAPTPSAPWATARRDWSAAAITPTVPPPGCSPAQSSCTSWPTKNRCPMTPRRSWTERTPALTARP